jgi:transcriptional regulator GlxA family with amidase domain
MDRRAFAALAATSLAVASRGAQAKTEPQIQGHGISFGPIVEDRRRPKVGMLMFPGMTLMDFLAPQSALAPSCDVHAVWKNKDEMETDSGLVLRATSTFAECPRDLDVIFVGGGPGQAAVMEDPETLRFLADRGARAKYVTSVCTGALVLGAAGLLQGYRAGTHWAALPVLPLFGATAVADRIVVDRNRITAGGVTSGLDFGLRLVATLVGDDVARIQQLAMQYDPQPPYDVGVPAKAGPELTKLATAWMMRRNKVPAAAMRASKSMALYTPKAT